MSLSFAQISFSNGGVLSGKSSINSLHIRDSEGTLVQPRNRRNIIQNAQRPPSKLSNSAQFEEEPEKLKVQKEIPDAIIKVSLETLSLVLLVIISYVVIQISRIWQTKDQNTVLVFYLSLIPFTSLIVISREVHIITLLLWCSSILAIFLQSGIPNLSFHISVYSALGIFLYGGAVVFMKQFFRIKCPFLICGQPLKPPIDDRVEIILACAVVVLQLYTANADLRRQIHQERQSDILDQESNKTVLQILGEIRDSDAADAYMVKELDRLMKILISDQLHARYIQKSADADGSEWLKSMMQAPKHEVASATASLESGFDSSLMSHGIPGTQGPTMLHDIDNPNFDVAVIESISNGRVLFYIGYYLFLKHNLLKIPESNQLTPEEHFASLVAAIIRDFMHPGVNNTFLINTYVPLATRYNDLVVLENFHCSTVFELMSANTEKDILKVLATDIAAHFDWIGKFKNKVSATSSGGGARINFEVKLDRRLVTNMAIKCADVNNPSKPLAQCKY
ncbi:hypothetical protein CcCBS67573_g08426 [Chytriomyces confervae]|uniref:PDEase domain-containing protein n=1 Tax=Chytriomyces confervae TaxID=246404 RepID=A0A507EM36_9FUNG|nr:hypothetical protein CcCBS67573_g08426 [Chytriomyces confervae]